MAHKITGANEKMTPKREDNRRDAIQKQIDENLRRVYEQDSSDEIPDRFLELLQKLREQE
ncbi:NepR family anti-sigma factor [Paracoccus alkanivorans]|nr:NepR family anti-sigma factor [Paracoccus alkanivorans]